MANMANRTGSVLKLPWLKVPLHGSADKNCSVERQILVLPWHPDAVNGDRAAVVERASLYRVVVGCRPLVMPKLYSVKQWMVCPCSHCA